MKKTNIMIVAGYLGAGKTTSILSIAKYMLKEGKKVGIITNDHGNLSANAEYMKHHGLNVLEINGGCLSSQLNKFEDKLKSLQKNGPLDFILVEPVGSCIDIVATIMKPIKENKNGWANYHILPLSVIADPVYLKTKLQNEKINIPKEVEYLIQKQLEEADVIVLNKEDDLCKAEATQLCELVNIQYPKKKLLLVSASQNIGIQEWIYEILQMGLNSEAYANQILDINYEKFTQAEKEIGWINLSCEFTVNDHVSAVIMITSLAERIKSLLKKNFNEIAHLKILFYNNDSSCGLNCTSVSGENNINHHLKTSINYGNLMINIRAYSEVKQLEDLTKTTLNNTVTEIGGSINNLQMEYITPSKPKPVYRYL